MIFQEWKEKKKQKNEVVAGGGLDRRCLDTQNQNNNMVWKGFRSEINFTCIRVERMKVTWPLNI